MAFAFVIMGIVFGAFAASTTIAFGGSVVLAVLAYSCIGTIGAVASVGFFVWLQSVRDYTSDQSEITTNRPVSA